MSTGKSKNYELLLTQARAKGEVKQVRHLEGWRSVKKTSLLYLYTQGKVSVQLAMKYKPTAKHHLAALDTGKISINDLVKVGVNLQNLENYRTRRLNFVNRAVKNAEKVIVASKVMVKNRFGETISCEVKTKIRPSQQQVAVAVAVAQAEERARAKKASARVRERGYEVQLTEAQKVELMQKLVVRPLVIK
jgi:hypothetical protein